MVASYKHGPVKTEERTRHKEHLMGSTPSAESFDARSGASQIMDVVRGTISVASPKAALKMLETFKKLGFVLAGCCFLLVCFFVEKLGLKNKLNFLLLCGDIFQGNDGEQAKNGPRICSNRPANIMFAARCFNKSPVQKVKRILNSQLKPCTQAYLETFINLFQSFPKPCSAAKKEVRTVHGPYAAGARDQPLQPGI